MKKKFLLRIIALCILFCSATLLSNAQAPSIKWQKTIGGAGDDYPNSIIKLSDGNILVSGATASTFPGSHGGYDAFISKLNPKGKTIWIRVYGGTGDDSFTDVIQNDNGSFTAVGSTNSIDGDVSGNHGGDFDGWVVMLSSEGNLKWQKCYGGSGDDQFTSITKGRGNTFVSAGFSTSNDGDVNGNHGDYDGWVVKSGNNGNILWSKCIGGSAYDDIFGIDKVTGNSYVATGGTASNDGDISGNHGGDYDAYAIRLDDNGNLSWSKCYGGSDFEFPNVSTILTDGNICFTGVTLSNDGDVNGYHGGHNDSWTVKIDKNTGDIIWQMCDGYPEANHGEAGFGITATTDGGVLVGAETGFHDQLATIDAKAIRVDKNGNSKWSIILGGTDGDWATGVIQTGDGDFILSCYALSTDGDITNPHGEGDVWIVKLDGDGSSHNHREANNNSVSNNFSLNSFPNPFSNSITISFSISQAENVSVKIYDITGRLVKTLVDVEMKSAIKQLEWDGIDANGNAMDAGIYFLNISSSTVQETVKIQKL